MYTRRDDRQLHIGLLILLLTLSFLTADGRQYKLAKERQLSGEQTSAEGPNPFSAEFGEFFEGSPKESSESFGFHDDFNPDYVPYSESRNVTKYVNPAETYHSVKDMPGHGRENQRSFKDDSPGYRSKDDTPYKKDYRKESYRKEGGNYKDEPSRKDDNYSRKEGGYSRDDAYSKDGGYRKSDSYRKDESYSSKDEPTYRSRESSSDRRESSSYRRNDKRDYDRPSYSKGRGEYRNRKDGPSSYRREDGPSRREEPEERGNNKKKPIQNLYDDWSPEDDKPSYNDKDRDESDRESSDYDESSDYRDREEPPPPATSSRYEEKGSRKSVPTSMRPGPPYYSSSSKKQPAEARVHSSSFGVRHDYPPPPTTQSYYAPSASPRKSGSSRDFHHRKGEPLPSKNSRYDKDWSDFRPSPPDPLQNSRSKSRDDYPQSEYSSPVPNKAKVSTTTQKPNRQNCVKLKKVTTPDSTNGKYVKKMATCFVCTDEKTGTNYEECSYETDSKTRPFVKTTGKEEATRSQASHREKRDIGSKIAPTESTDRSKREKDYYDSSKEEKDSYSDSKGNDSEEGEPEGDGPSDEDPSEDDNCYKKRKGEMTCVVCETANKKGTYEQCSYASDPKKNKYEHSVQKVYGSPRLPESSPPFSNKDGFNSKDDDYNGSVEFPSKSDYPSSDYDGGSKSKSNRKAFGDSFGFDFDGFGSLFGDDLSVEGFDFGSIPEATETEGQFATKDEKFNFNPSEMEDIDVSKNIGDFGQKNRSNCKKVMKNKMTCYQCITSKGTKNEECMYVESSEPKSKRLSFSQVQEYRFDPDNSSDADTDYPSFAFGKRKYKKYHPDLTDMKFFNKLKEKATMEASRWPRSPIKTIKNNNLILKNDSNHNATLKQQDQDGAASETGPSGDEDASEEEDEPEDDDSEEEEDDDEEDESDEDSDNEPKDEYNTVPTEPPEIDLKEAEKGEYHSDTESAWDAKLGISLPRYMLERSEHEAIFDEVLASG